MVKRGDTVEKVYGRAMEVAEEITRETEEKLKNATSEEEKQQYTYKLEACRFFKEYLKDNGCWHFAYCKVIKMTDKDKLDGCLDKLAYMFSRYKRFKIGTKDIFNEMYMSMMGECMMPMDITYDTDFVCANRDTKLIVAWYGMRDIQIAIKRIKDELGYDVIPILPRKGKVYDAQATYDGLMYALDTPENREIIDKYYKRA